MKIFSLAIDDKGQAITTGNLSLEESIIVILQVIKDQAFKAGQQSKEEPDGEGKSE